MPALAKASTSRHSIENTNDTHDIRPDLPIRYTEDMVRFLNTIYPLLSMLNLAVATTIYLCCLFKRRIPSSQFLRKTYGRATRTALVTPTKFKMQAMRAFSSWQVCHSSQPDNSSASTSACLKRQVIQTDIYCSVFELRVLESISRRLAIWQSLPTNYSNSSN